MWHGYGVCSNLASSGEPPPLLHMTTLTTDTASIRNFNRAVWPWTLTFLPWNFHNTPFWTYWARTKRTDERTNIRMEVLNHSVICGPTRGPHTIQYTVQTQLKSQRNDCARLHTQQTEVINNVMRHARIERYRTSGPCSCQAWATGVPTNKSVLGLIQELQWGKRESEWTSAERTAPPGSAFRFAIRIESPIHFKQIDSFCKKISLSIH